MKERQRVEPHLLTPEYWNGHGSSDNCQWREAWPEDRPIFFQERGLEYACRKTLEEFKLLADKTLVRDFKEGEIFDGTQFPEGTIIKFNQEHLYLTDNIPIGSSLYHRYDYWGVTFGFDSKWGRKTGLMKYSSGLVSDDGRHDYPGHPSDVVMRVGGVEHTRIRRKDYESESLHRVNEIKLYKMGKGLPEENKLSKLFNLKPFFGRI